MAANQKKVDLKNIISQLKKELEKARLPENSRRRSQDEKAAGNRVHALLYSDGRATESTRKTGKVSLTTYNRYLTDIRKSLIEMGDVNHTWRAQIKRAIKNHQGHEVRLTAMIDAPLATIITELAAWRAELVGDRKTVALRELLKNGLRPYPVVFEGLMMKGAFSEDFQIHQKSKIKEKQSALVDVDFDALVALSTELLCVPESDPLHAEKLALGVSLAAGRRQVETCAQGTFSAIPRKPYFLKFYGQAKAKGQKEEFKIPALAPAKLIIDAVKRLRKTDVMRVIFEFMNGVSDSEKNKMFNNKSRCFTLASRDILESHLGKKQNGEQWTFKDSRALYAKAAYLLYKQDQKKAKKQICTEDIFYSEFLGHTDDQAKESYKAFNVSGSKIERITETMIKEETEKNSPAARLDGLRSLACKKIITENKTYTNVMCKIIAMIEQSPTQHITKTWMRTDVKGGKTITLNALFEIIEKAGLTI